MVIDYTPHSPIFTSQENFRFSQNFSKIYFKVLAYIQNSLLEKLNIGTQFEFSKNQ